MITKLQPGALASVEFKPQAIVKRPPAFFAALGIEFDSGEDDLNAYRVAALERDGIQFALMRHEGTPIDETEICLPDSIPIKRLPDIVGGILTAFDLPGSALAWLRESTDTPF